MGDYLHAEDAAQAVAALLRAPALRYSAYNIAQGCVASTGELVTWAAQRAPGFHAVIAPPAEADILQDESLRDGMWGAYDISRITAETGWRPRPAREALHAYMQWLEAQRQA